MITHANLLGHISAFTYIMVGLLYCAAAQYDSDRL